MTFSLAQPVFVTEHCFTFLSHSYVEGDFQETQPTKKLTKGGKLRGALGIVPC